MPAAVFSDSNRYIEIRGSWYHGGKKKMEAHEMQALDAGIKTIASLSND